MFMLERWEEAAKMAQGVSPEGRRATTALQALRNLGITTETVPYREPGLRQGMAGIFCKNLVLKDRKGQYYMVVCSEDVKVDLKKLKQELKAHRNFSFATAEDLDLLLGCRPGAVSPFGVLEDDEHKVLVVLDNRLLESKQPLNFHPMDADFTTLIAWGDLITFLQYDRTMLVIL